MCGFHDYVLLSYYYLLMSVSIFRQFYRNADGESPSNDKVSILESYLPKQKLVRR